MHYRRLSAVSLPFLLMALAGCAHVRVAVAPKPPKELTVEANADDPRLPFDFKKQYLEAKDDAAKTALRNQYVRTLMAKIDTEFLKFTNDLYVGRSSINFAGDLANLGLTSAGAVVGDAELKAILAATATGVTGVSANFDKRFFQDQAISALLTTMNASRLAVQATITTNLKKPANEYTLDDALLDVLAYYRAGTILSALTEIQKDQGNKAQEKQAIIDDVKGVRKLAPTPDTRQQNPPAGQNQNPPAGQNPPPVQKPPATAPEQ